MKGQIRTLFSFQWLHGLVERQVLTWAKIRTNFPLQGHPETQREKITYCGLELDGASGVVS